MRAFRVPGVFWIALVAFIARWIPDLFPGAPWLDEVLLILLAIAKGLEVWLSPSAVTRGSGERTVSPVVRWLMGGG